VEGLDVLLSPSPDISDHCRPLPRSGTVGVEKNCSPSYQRMPSLGAILGQYLSGSDLLS